MKGDLMEESLLVRDSNGSGYCDSLSCLHSIEHFGLGRYGDPIAPHGDLEAMQRLKNILTEDGVLFLSVPIGPDLVVWNSHRIYGPIRFPMLIDGWEVIQSFGFNESLFDAKRLGHWYIQPVWILKPQHS